MHCRMSVCRPYASVVASRSDTPALQDRIRRLKALLQSRQSLSLPVAATPSAGASASKPVAAKPPVPPTGTKDGTAASETTTKSLDSESKHLEESESKAAAVKSSSDVPLEAGVLLSESLLWKLQVLLGCAAVGVSFRCHSAESTVLLFVVPGLVLRIRGTDRVG